jgi:hypothetical protein
MIGDPFHIVELHAKLQRNREEAAAAREYNNDPTKYKLRIASVAALEKQRKMERRIKERDALRLLELGCSYNEIHSITSPNVRNITYCKR